MIRRLSIRMVPITNRAAEYAPAAPACCNVCRTCTTTNLAGLLLGGMAVAAAGVSRFARRVKQRA
jgi:hypothetical protein